jgi:hypothetical protein
MTRSHDERKHAKASIIKAGGSNSSATSSQKLASLYSEPRKVVNSSRHTVWLENGPWWNVRGCLLRWLSVSATQSADNLRSTAEPSAAISGTGSDEEGTLFSFAVRPHTLPNRPSNQPSEPSRPSGPRRSDRVRKQRDFEPVVSHCSMMAYLLRWLLRFILIY